MCFRDCWCAAIFESNALKESSLWLHGPEFLSKESAYWPVQPVNVQAKEELCELKSAKPTVSSLLNTCTEKQEANLESIINPESYSSLTKLIKVTSLVLLFVKKLKRRRDGSTDQEEFTSKFTSKLRRSGLNTFKRVS